MERLSMLRAEQRDWLRLILIPGVGTTHFIRLLARFQTPGQVLKASRNELREVISENLAEHIVQYRDVVDVASQERLMAQAGADFVTLEDAAYPPLLAEIYSPPLALFTRGALMSDEEPCIALVGTRRASPYGLRMAERLGRGLAARGVTVVSGMASGIDAAAHRGAIEAGGRTVAVLGCGVDVVYPPQNEQLMKDIAASGCVISHFFMGDKPLPNHFPDRNRVISGLCLGTIVIEAPLSSGALITARHAAEQGREVFAVPGQVGMRTSEGPHALIREGAKLVERVEDVLAELNIAVAAPVAAPAHDESAAEPVQAQPAPVAVTTPEKPRRAALSGTEQEVLSVLAPDGSFVDEIAAACRISISDALSSLTLLELKGLIRQFSGKRFAPV
jgi:DNA processing protein